MKHILLYALALFLAVVLSTLNTLVAITGIGLLLWVDPNARRAMEELMALPERIVACADDATL